jgi:hypothetical protein
LGNNFSPYSPPGQPPGPGYFSAPPDFLAPARYAAILLIIVGALMTLFAVILGAAMMRVSPAEFQQMIDTSPFLKDKSQLPPGIPLAQLARNVYNGISIAGIAIGPLLLIMGVLVRSGRRVPVVLTIVVCGTVITCELLSGLLGCAGSYYLAFGACAGFIPSILVGIALGWLLKVLKALPRIQAAQQQWQANFAASQQQQSRHQMTPTYPSPQNPGGYSPPAGSAQPNFPQGNPQTYSPPSIGYGAMPPVQQPPAQGGPPVRHPPLPPDQGSGNPPGQG